MYRDSLKKIVKSSAILLSGNIASSLLGIGVISILTKNFSPKEYGVIIMLQAYIIFIGQFFTFQTWQALIKYCTNAIENNDEMKFIGYLQTGIVLDFLGALVAFLSSFVLLSPISILLQFDYNLLSPYMVYSVVILTSLIGTPTAILRITDSYKYFNYVTITNWLLKFLLVSILTYYEMLTVYNVILAYIFSETLANLLLFFHGIRALGKFHISFFDILPKKTTLYFIRNNMRFLQFIFRLSINGSVMGTSRSIDELIVGSIISPAAAGIFKIIKVMGSVLTKLIDPLYVTFYPEINLYVAKNDRFSIIKIIKKITLYMVFFSLMFLGFFYLFGEFFIELFFSKYYLSGFSAMMLYFIGLLIGTIFFYSQPLMMAFGFEAIDFKINILCSLIYLSMLYYLTIKLNIIGVSVSFIIFWILVSTFKLIYIQNKTNLFWKKDA